MNPIAIHKPIPFYYSKQKGALFTLLFSAVLCLALSEYSGFIQIVGFILMLTGFHAAELYESRTKNKFSFYTYTIVSVALYFLFLFFHPNPTLSLSLSGTPAIIYLLTPKKYWLLKHKLAFLALVCSGSFCYLGNQTILLVAHLFLFYIYFYSAISLIHWKMKKATWKNYQFTQLAFFIILLMTSYSITNMLPAILGIIIIIKYFITSIYSEKFMASSLKSIGLWELCCTFITILTFFSHIQN